MPEEAILQELLFSIQNPTNEQLFINRCPKLFAKDDSRAWIDLYRPRVAPPVQIRVAVDSTSSGAGPSRVAATTQSVGDDIDYIGRCKIPYYRVTNVDELTSRIEQFGRDRERWASSNLPGRSVICIVRQLHSTSRLQTSHALLDYVLSTFDPKVKDFVLPFGLKLAETDIGGPRVWFYPANFGGAEQGVEYTKFYGETATFYREYPLLMSRLTAADCAYTLKYVELSRQKRPDSPWAERQTTIAMRRSETGGWLLISPSTPMQEYLDRYMRGLNEDEPENSFAIHLLFIEAAMINWQAYMAFLTHETNGGADRAIVTTFGKENDKENFRTLEIEDRQKLQTIQDSIINMFAMLDSTIDITSSLEEKYYIFHLCHDTIAKSRIRSDPVAFGFHEKLQELKYTRQKLESLHERVKAIEQLSSSALDLENGLSLRALAEEARQESKVMYSLTEKATHDAAAVKVITVITMIYLPLTVVANFFSTQFVSQKPVGGGHAIQVADNWWILAAVGFPLTAVTFFMWWAISQRMFLIDALQELRMRSTDQLRVLVSQKGSKKSASDQESLAGSVMVSGAMVP